MVSEHVLLLEQAIAMKGILAYVEKEFICGKLLKL